MHIVGFPLGPFRLMKLELVLGFRLVLVILAQIISFFHSPILGFGVNETFWGVGVYTKLKK